MGEFERSQEGAITAAEAILFVDAVKRFQPLFRPAPPDELIETKLGEGVVEAPIVTSIEAKEGGLFGIDDLQLALEHKTSSLTAGGKKFQMVAWKTTTSDLIENEELAGTRQVIRRQCYEVKDYEEWGILVPLFATSYWLVDPETGEMTLLKSKLEEETGQEAEEIARSAMRSGASRQEAVLRAAMTAVELEEARGEELQELEAQVGLRDDSEVFTPERFAEVMELLGRITPGHKLDQ